MAHRAVTSPLLVLLAHRVIALPRRCLRISSPVSAFVLQAQETPLALTSPSGIPLRI
jgi:hypothetical protein